MLAFDSASGTFANRRLAQGLSRSLSAFSSFMRDYLDPVFNADQCAHYVDDIGIAAKLPEKLTNNLPTVFERFQIAGIELSLANCHFGTKKVDFLRGTITPVSISTQKQKVASFFEEVKFPCSEKPLQRYIGFLDYSRKYILRLAE